MEEFNKLFAAVTAATADVAKAVDGNKSAGTRVRNAMQNVKQLAQEVRVKILEVTK